MHTIDPTASLPHTTPLSPKPQRVLTPPNPHRGPGSASNSWTKPAAGTWNVPKRPSPRPRRDSSDPSQLLGRSLHLQQPTRRHTRRLLVAAVTAQPLHRRLGNPHDRRHPPAAPQAGAAPHSSAGGRRTAPDAVPDPDLDPDPGVDRGLEEGQETGAAPPPLVHAATAARHTEPSVTGRCRQTRAAGGPVSPDPHVGPDPGGTVRTWTTAVTCPTAGRM